MATWAIGDIQGCYAELRALLHKAGFRPRHDTLWLVGDLVNRGPNNVDTLHYLMDLERLVMVLGNHDLHFLAVAAGHAEPRGKDTITDLLEAADCDLFVDWLRHQPLMHLDDEWRHVLVHAGLPPMWDVRVCCERAGEVEAAISSPDYQRFLGKMYGNEPDQWDDALTGVDRLRLITNYFTRMRFCTGTGQLELTAKETASPPGFSPWFTFERPDDYTIIFGHWAAIEGRTDNPRAIALDTGCVWGRELTAMRLEDGKRTSVSRQSTL